MEIGARIKSIRTEKKISVEEIAKKLGVSKTTVYRYEDSSIEKIPINIFEKLCSILEVSPAQLMGNAPVQNTENLSLPKNFDNAHDAMAFILKTPTIAAFGGYDPGTMSEETIIAFANEILKQLEFVVYKYNSQLPKDDK